MIAKIKVKFQTSITIPFGKQSPQATCRLISHEHVLVVAGAWLVTCVQHYFCLQNSRIPTQEPGLSQIISMSETSTTNLEDSTPIVNINSFAVKYICLHPEFVVEWYNQDWHIP